MTTLTVNGNTVPVKLRKGWAICIIGNVRYEATMKKKESLALYALVHHLRASGYDVPGNHYMSHGYNEYTAQNVTTILD